MTDGTLRRSLHDGVDVLSCEIELAVPQVDRCEIEICGNAPRTQGERFLICGECCIDFAGCAIEVTFHEPRVETRRVRRQSAINEYQRRLNVSLQRGKLCLPEQGWRMLRLAFPRFLKRLGGFFQPAEKELRVSS